VLEVKYFGPEFVCTVQYIVVFVMLRNIPRGRSLNSFDPFALSERGLLSIPKCPVKSYKVSGSDRETVTLGINYQIWDISYLERSCRGPTIHSFLERKRQVIFWQA
jgi:hypothetical protein